MKRWQFLLLFPFLTLRLTGQEISVPECPADHILDQTGTVTAVERQAVQGEMARTMEESGLGVYLVLLNSAAEEPPPDVARRLAQAWKGSADRVVVLTAPDISPPLVVAVSGVSFGALPATALQEVSAAAVAAGVAAGPGLTSMLEAARSVVARVQAYRDEGVLGPKPIVVPAAPAAPDAAQPGKHLVAWIAAGSLAFCLLALLLMRRGRQTALIFPPADFRRRFSAPHSGGNDAVVHFGK